MPAHALPLPPQRGLFRYLGQWEGDLQQGQGKCVYADGATYDGAWRAGKRCAAAGLGCGRTRDTAQRLH